MTYHYPRELADALLALGLAPTSTTPPAFARGAIDELYKYELRRLRHQHRIGEVARDHYLGRVIALRKKYWMLTLPLAAWERICSTPTS